MAIGNQFGGIRNRQPGGDEEQVLHLSPLQDFEFVNFAQKVVGEAWPRRRAQQFVKAPVAQIGVDEQGTLSLLAGDSLRQISGYEGLSLVWKRAGDQQFP